MTAPTPTPSSEPVGASGFLAAPPEQAPGYGEILKSLMAERDEWHKRAVAAEARLSQSETALAQSAIRVTELEGQLRAATDLLASAEKIVPGLITTAGSFALGDVAEARAEREEALVALQRIADDPSLVIGQARDIARAALASVPPAGDSA